MPSPYKSKQSRYEIRISPIYVFFVCYTFAEVFGSEAPQQMSHSLGFFQLPHLGQYRNHCICHPGLTQLGWQVSFTQVNNVTRQLVHVYEFWEVVRSFKRPFRGSIWFGCHSNGHRYCCGPDEDSKHGERRFPDHVKQLGHFWVDIPAGHPSCTRKAPRGINCPINFSRWRRRVVRGTPRKCPWGNGATDSRNNADICGTFFLVWRNWIDLTSEQWYNYSTSTNNN